MTIDDYEGFVLAMRKYRGHGHNLTYPILALAGEAGELANEMKKVLRGDQGPWVDGTALPPDVRTKMLLELGDVVWYAVATAWELGSSLPEVMQMNRDKLMAKNPSFVRPKADL